MLSVGANEQQQRHQKRLHSALQHREMKPIIVLLYPLLPFLQVMLGAGPDEQQQRQRQQELELERMRRGYHHTHSRLVTDEERHTAAGSSSSNASAPWGSSGYLPPGASAAGYYPQVPKPDVPPIRYNTRQQQQQQMRKHKVRCLCEQQVRSGLS
jgi:hypothetical protein